MPLISIETNQEISNEMTLKEISAEIATLLGKPESYVMLKFEHNSQMLFAGNNQPLAHLKLKSLGMPEEKTADFSASLCQLMKDYFSIPADRIYIEFSNPERHMWGWNEATF